MQSENLIPKRFTITSKQSEFLEKMVNQFGFRDQSGFVREALEEKIQKVRRRKTEEALRQGAKLAKNYYEEDGEAKIFTTLDGEPFHEEG